MFAEKARASHPPSRVADVPTQERENQFLTQFSGARVVLVVAAATAAASFSIMALVMVAKWPGSGKSKTRLSTQLVGAGSCEDEAQARRFVERFVHSSASDLAERFGEARARGLLGCECVLLYAPPIDEARAYFTDLLEAAGVHAEWRLMPVLAASSAGGSDLGAILADATRRVRAACSVRRVAFIGSDCPTLPLRDVQIALERAADASGNVAAICPATDGGYTLLALPETADEEACFAGVHWSSHDTCISQLAALTRARLLCSVGDTHADVDELADLEALAKRLSGQAPRPREEAMEREKPSARTHAQQQQQQQQQVQQQQVQQQQQQQQQQVQQQVHGARKAPSPRPVGEVAGGHAADDTPRTAALLATWRAQMPGRVGEGDSEGR